MSNYSSLKATINANVKANGNQEITGPVMNSVLNAMVDSLGAGYQYMGKAVPSTNPGTPDAKVFYLASDPGTYTNFNGLVVADGEVAFLKWDAAWSKEVTGAATAAQLTQLGQEIKVEIYGAQTLDGEDKAGYVWGGKLSDLTSPSYLQKAFQVSNGANIRIQAEIIRQNVNTAIPAIAFVEDYVSGATATVIYQGGDSASTVDMNYTPASDGYVIVLYKVGGAVKANNLLVTMEAEDGGIKEQLQTLSQETGTIDTRIEDIEDYLKEESVVPITPETKYGYVWVDKLSQTTSATSGWIQKAFAVSSGDAVNIKCQVTQQNANVPSIAFVENYVDGETATILRDSTTGSANVDFVAPANGYVIVLYSAGGEVKADNLKVVKTEYAFPDKQAIIKIKPGGGGDYDNFRDAFDYINAHPNNDGYLVEVYPGEYDVLADYTAEEINAASYSATGNGFCGIYVKNTHIKGIGHKEEIIIKGYLSTTDYSTEVRTQISTLNVDGNCTIENVTVTSDNLRYTIHDDFNDSAECTHVYKDCVLINYHSTNGVTKSNCIGIGTKSGLRIVVDSCRLNSTMGYHNGGNFISADEVDVINTRIEGGVQLNDTDSGVDGKLMLINSFCAYITHNVITASPHISITVIGGANFPIVSPASSIYKHDGVSEKAKSMYMAVGKCSRCDGSSPLSSVTTVNQGGYCNGICIGIDGNTAIIQNAGWVGANHLGSTDATSWVVGDLLGVGASGYLVPVSGNDRAFAVVDFIYNGEPYIKILL